MWCHCHGGWGQCCQIGWEIGSFITECNKKLSVVRFSLTLHLLSRRLRDHCAVWIGQPINESSCVLLVTLVDNITVVLCYWFDQPIKSINQSTSTNIPLPGRTWQERAKQSEGHQGLRGNDGHGCLSRCEIPTLVHTQIAWVAVAGVALQCICMWHCYCPNI